MYVNRALAVVIRETLPAKLIEENARLQERLADLEARLEDSCLDWCVKCQKFKDNGPPSDWCAECIAFCCEDCLDEAESEACANCGYICRKCNPPRECIECKEKFCSNHFSVCRICNQFVCTNELDHFDKCL